MFVRLELSPFFPKSVLMQECRDLEKHYGMSTGAPGDSACFPYREAAGSLMYLMNDTRPDIEVVKCTKFCENPTQEHWLVKQLLRCVRRTND